jgi:cyclopropane fatty-acyl-phospholipid synthase-like methyltransferase
MELLHLNEFYSENSSESWKKVLGDKMHYHSGLVNSEGIHPMDYSIMQLYDYIEPNTKILDCGCGWGGPARQIMKDLNCDVTGITVSEEQANYIEDFKVIHADLHEVELTEQYDTAIFVESYCHLHTPIKVLKNISKHVNSVVIRDYVNLTRNFVNYDVKWKMMMGNKSKYIHDLTNAGFTVKDFIIRPHYYQPESSIWLNNIMKMPENEITGQIKLLKEYCEKCLMNYSEYGETTNGICTIHAVIDK